MSMKNDYYNQKSLDFLTGLRHFWQILEVLDKICLQTVGYS